MFKPCVIACGVRWAHTESIRWPWSPQRWWGFSWLGAVCWKWWVPTQVLWKGRKHFALLSHLCSSPNLALTMWKKCGSAVCSHCKYIRIVLCLHRRRCSHRLQNTLPSGECPIDISFQACFKTFCSYWSDSASCTPWTIICVGQTVQLPFCLELCQHYAFSVVRSLSDSFPYRVTTMLVIHFSVNKAYL